MSEGINRPPNEEQDELESLGVPSPANSSSPSLVQDLCYYLNVTEPARLLVHTAIVLVLASIAGVLGMRFADDGWFPYAMGAIAFFAGLIGALLPMWAVGRLISDAIREGNKS